MMWQLYAVAVAGVWAQQPGVHVEEFHPEMPLWTCDTSGCSKETKSIVLDANWRWLHNGEYTNCYKDGEFDKTLCSDPLSCAKNCHLEGNSEKQYKSTYGIKTDANGLGMGFLVLRTSGDFWSFWALLFGTFWAFWGRF